MDLKKLKSIHYPKAIYLLFLAVGVDGFMKHLTAEFEWKVASLLPNKFGIILDGWSGGTTHFACAPSLMTLLSIATPYEEQNYDAQTLKNFIMDVLALCGKSLSDLWFLVGDNAPDLIAVRCAM